MSPELVQVARLRREKGRGYLGSHFSGPPVRLLRDLIPSCTLNSHYLEVEMTFPRGP